MRDPAVRARGVQGAIKWADSFEEANGEVTARIEPRVLEHVMSTAPGGWIPFELDRLLIAAIYEVHGKEGSARCWRDFMTDYMKGPLLEGFVGMSTRLFGLSPGAVVRAGPKGW